MSEDLKMWLYWKNKYGTLDAIRDYYPETMKFNIALQQAVCNLEINEKFINKIMEELADETYESNDYGC